MSYKILIVEDESIIAMTLERILTKAGYEVVAKIPSGEEAVNQVYALAPDLILLDIHLAGRMDGIETLAALRKITNVPVIYLTSQVDGPTSMRVRHSDASAFLSKPVGVLELQNTVELCISAYKAEQQLRESEKNFRLLVSNIPGIVYRCRMDSEYTMLWISEHVQRICGYPPAYFTGLNAKSFLSIIHTDDQKLVKKSIRDAVQKEVPYVIEYRLMHADGYEVWVSEKGQLAYDEQANEYSLHGVIFDISERKAMELEIERKKARLEAIFNANPDMYLLINENHQVVECNSGNSENIFLPQEALLNFKLHEFLPPAFLSRAIQAVNDVLTNGIPVNTEYSMKFLEESVEFEARFLPITNHKEVLCIIRNISDMRHKEAELERYKIKLDSVLNSTQDIVWSYDAVQRKVIYVNAAVETIYGLSIETICSSLTPWKQMVFKEDLSRIIKTYPFINGSSEFQFRIRKPDGSVRWLADRINVKRNESGRLVSIEGITRDITEYKNTLQKVKQTENLLKQINESSPHIISLYDWPSRRFVYVNNQVENMLGYSQNYLIESENILKEKIVFEQSAASDYPLRAFRTADDNDIIELECSVTHKKGHIVWLKTRNKIFGRDKDGIPTLILSTSVDITEEKKLQQELLLKNKSIDASINAIAIVDAQQSDYPLMYVNKAFEQLSGYKATEVLGKNWSFLYRDDLFQPEIEQLQKAMQNGDFCSVTLRNYKKNYSLFWNTFNLSPIYDNKGTLTHFVAVQTDITAIKNLEEKLLRINKAVESTQDAICISDVGGDSIYTNKAFIDLFGINHITLNEKGGQASLLQSPDLDEEMVRLMSDGHIWSGETYVINKAGKITPVLLRANPIKNEQDTIIGFMRIYMDISERKMTQALQKAKEIAENTAALKQQFLANMSHEIRTPMNGILGMTEFLLKTDLQPVQQEYANTIKKSADYLLAIINDILDLSKLEAGKVKLTPTIFRLRSLADYLERLFSFQLSAKGLTFEVNISAAIPEYIYADENRLMQVLSNLVSNAIKFTEQGKVSLRLYVTEQKGRLITLGIDVADTGIGIREEELGQLFQNFTQLDNSLSRKHGGTGLGLAIARQLVILMGGDIHVNSQWGTGSTFSFTFSANRVSEEEYQHQLQAQPATGLQYIAEKPSSGKHVLLVEDKYVNQQVASTILKNAGCSVDIAEDGLMALSMFEEGKYNLILIDIQMPVMDGVEATRILRERYNNLPPIIAVSAHAMEGDAEKYLALGMDDYLSKPVESAKLVAMLQNWLNPNTALARSSAHPEPVAEKPEEQILNPSAIQVLQDTSSPDSGMIQMLFTSFLEDMEDLMQQLKKGISEDKLHEVMIAVHTIKGLSGTIGASKVFQIAKVIDQSLKEQNWNKTLSLMPELQEKYNELKIYIEDKYKLQSI